MAKQGLAFNCKTSVHLGSAPVTMTLSHILMDVKVSKVDAAYGILILLYMLSIKSCQKELSSKYLMFSVASIHEILIKVLIDVSNTLPEIMSGRISSLEKLSLTAPQ